ncbi:MAG: chlorite dismutase [Phycisphaera sp.]|nr:chlorite dismutase [Phycisphaera sp.]
MGNTPANNRLFNFIGGARGRWHAVKALSVIGDPLPDVAAIDIVPGRCDTLPPDAKWRLRGVTSYERYVTRDERTKLVANSPTLDRPGATSAAFIAISKSAEWWGMTADERREILESRSRHIATGMSYLPEVARRLHHGRDLGEPFDFLTWFEFAPEDAEAFDALVDALRQSEEWRYVSREVDLRLVRNDPVPIGAGTGGTDHAVT